MSLLIKIIGYFLLLLTLLGAGKQWLFSYNFSQGEKLYQENQFVEAIWKTKQAIKYFPSHPEPHRLLAKIYLELLPTRRSEQKEILRKAEEEILKAISLEPGYPYYWSLLGRISELLEQLREIPQISPRKAFHRACLIDPNNPLFPAMYTGYLIRKKDFEPALILIKKLLELSPSTALELGKIWLHYNPEPEPLLKMFSSNPETLGEFCEWMMHNTDQKSLALKYFEAIYQKYPKQNKLIFRYARILLNTGEECEKIKQVLEPFFSSPLEEPALKIYSSCLYRQKKWQEEEKVLLKLIRISPDSAHYRQILSRVYLNTGQGEKAKEQLLWLLENAPQGIDRGKIYLSLAKIYQRESNQEKALEYYQKYLKLNPENKKIRQKIEELTPEQREIIYSPWRLENEK